MNRWLDPLIGLLEADQAAVLVTVADCQGSTPRESGARMLVTRDAVSGTVGGGQLEWRAIAHARDLIATGHGAPGLVRYPLGAKLGQCCGGVMQLAFEPLDRDALPWLRQARTLAAGGLAWGRVAGLAPGPERCRVFGPRPEDSLNDQVLVSHARAVLAGGAGHARLLARAGETSLLVDGSPPPSLEVMLFGAGHVGSALADILRRQPLRLHWIDSRDPEAVVPHRERAGLTESDDPVAEVDGARSGTAFVVMTQSHALDFELVRAILGRGDFRYCGLIGSASKRAGFSARLRERGLDETLINRLRCPIGVEAVRGKEPEVIAVAVAAELLALRRPEPVTPGNPGNITIRA